MSAITRDGLGNLYVAEGGRIRKGVLNTNATEISRLANISIRTTAGSGTATLIVGMTIGGNSAAGRPVLFRAIGPALTGFGVAGVLADPFLSVFRDSTLVGSNDNWGGGAALSATFAQVGAFALAPPTGRDAALFEPALPSGPYSVQVNGVGGASGIVLAEIYDAGSFDPGNASSPRLVNLSARAQVGPGGEALIAGFVIAGTVPKTLLIRGIGPSLTKFGVAGALVDPTLELYSGQVRVDTNDDWGGRETMGAAFAAVGAFNLASDSKDAALLLTLPPGAYSAQVSAPGGTSGVALVEVYEVP
jgi:hypothetical protein